MVSFKIVLFLSLFFVQASSSSIPRRHPWYQSHGHGERQRHHFGHKGHHGNSAAQSISSQQSAMITDDQAAPSNTQSAIPSDDLGAAATSQDYESFEPTVVCTSSIPSGVPTGEETTEPISTVMPISTPSSVDASAASSTASSPESSAESSSPSSMVEDQDTAAPQATPCSPASVFGSPSQATTLTSSLPVSGGPSQATPSGSPTVSANNGTATNVTQTPSNGSIWQPVAGTTWQIQLSGSFSDPSLPADVFDIDLFDNTASTIATLHSNGRKVICYFSAGSYEDWRPDASNFLPSDKGNTLAGWPGEWWLNTNSANVRTIMAARIALAASNGCDGIDPDNVDGYDNDNGLQLTQADAVDYMTFLAGEAHNRGLSIGLKNAGGLVADLLHIMEWQINEQCIAYDECSLFAPFVDAGKPVFHIEYPADAPDVSTATKAANCNATATSGFSTVMKNLDLDAWVDAC